MHSPLSDRLVIDDFICFEEEIADRLLVAHFRPFAQGIFLESGGFSATRTNHDLPTCCLEAIPELFKGFAHVASLVIQGFHRISQVDT